MLGNCLGHPVTSAGICTVGIDFRRMSGVMDFTPIFNAVFLYFKHFCLIGLVTLFLQCASMSESYFNFFNFSP